MVPPAVIRVIAEVRVGGADTVPAALSLPLGETYSALLLICGWATAAVEGWSASSPAVARTAAPTAAAAFCRPAGDMGVCFTVLRPLVQRWWGAPPGRRSACMKTCRKTCTGRRP